MLLVMMREEGVAPDHFAFGAAVNACAKGGQWERAVALLDQVNCTRPPSSSGASV